MVKQFEAYHDNLDTYEGQAKVTYRVELLQLNGSAGFSEITTMSRSPVEINSVSVSKESTKIIVGSELSFTFKTETPDTYSAIFESEYGDWRLDYYNDDTGDLIWRGYVQPDNLSQTLFEPWTEISLSATDALKDLSETEFSDFVGQRSPMSAIKAALNEIGIPLDFEVKLNTYETTQPSDELCLLNLLIDDTRFVKQKDGADDVDSCLEVIEKILKPFQEVRLQQVGGKYVITNTNEPSSFEYSLDWDTLTPTRASANDVIAIDTMKYQRGTELSKISPIKRVDITHLNRNPGEALVDDLNNYSTGPWTINFSNYTAGDTLDVTVNTSDLSGENMTLTNPFQVEQITSDDIIIFQFAGKWTGTPGTAGIQLSINGQTTSASRTDFVDNNRITYSISLNVESGTNDYNVELGLASFAPGEVYDGTFEFSDFEIRRLTEKSIEYIGPDSISFDKLYRVSSDTGKRLKEEELYFADSGTSGDLGRFEIAAGVGSAEWNRYNKADGLALAVLYGKEYLKRSSIYQDYLSITVWDFDYILKPNKIIAFDGRQYTIDSYRRAFATNVCDLKLRELHLTDPTVTFQEVDLTSVDGESTQRVSQQAFEPSEDHNGLSGLQGGQAGQFYHLTSNDYSKLIADSIGTVSDVDITDIVAEQILKWDGTKFVPTALPFATFDTLNDTPLTKSPLNYIRADSLGNDLEYRTPEQVRADIGAGESFDSGTLSATGAISLSVTGREVIGGATTIQHSTSAGYKHIPSGGVVSQLLAYGGESGTASWTGFSDTIHGVRGGGNLHPEVSTSSAGFAPTLSGVGTQYLDGKGNWTTPSFIPDHDIIDKHTYDSGTGEKLIGRVDEGLGNVQGISIGAGLFFDGLTLKAQTTNNYYLTEVAYESANDQIRFSMEGESDILFALDTASGGLDLRYAQEEHNHSATNITSGTLAVERGGTGISSYSDGDYIKATGSTTLGKVSADTIRTDMGVPEIQSGTSAPSTGWSGTPTDGDLYFQHD